MTYLFSRYILREQSKHKSLIVGSGVAKDASVHSHNRQFLPLTHNLLLIKENAAGQPKQDSIESLSETRIEERKESFTMLKARIFKELWLDFSEMDLG